MKESNIQWILAVLLVTTGILMSGTAQAVTVFEEDFDSLTLGPFVSSSESGGDGTDWTDVPPTGWVRDNTTTPTGGPAEFFGFTFLDINSWEATAGQERIDFSVASGTVMVADGDEYDDDAGNGNVLTADSMNVFIETPATPFNVAAGTLNLTWANDFRAFDASQATIEVSYDGGASFNETVYSMVGTDERNTVKTIPLSNPASGSLSLRFGYTNADNDWWWAVDSISVATEVILPTLDLTVDRTDGSLLLSNRTGAAVNISGYQLSSAFEGLSPSDWVSIAENYDGDSGSLVDDTNDWVELTKADAHGDLSEADLETGNGGTLAHNQSINLGNAGAWIRNPNEDLVLEYVSNGVLETAIVTFEGGATYESGDVDTDGDIDATDWGIVSANQHTDLSESSLAEAYRLGDLTGDLQNNHADFVAFKAVFDGANGVGAFEAMIGAVPEPSTALLVMTGAICSLFTRRRDARD